MSNTILAIVRELLTPNLKDDLSFVIMLLKIQDIHPEIIIELIPCVTMSQRQYRAIMLALTQLRLFASLLPTVKGFKWKSYQNQRRIFRIYPQYWTSIVFAKFQNSVLKKMLVRCGFAGNLPSLTVVQELALNVSVVRRGLIQICPIQGLFLAPKEHLNVLRTGLHMQNMIAHVRSTYPHIVSFLAHNENALKNIIMVWRNQLDVKQISNGYLYDFDEPLKINDLFVLCMLFVITPEFDQSLGQVIQNCGYPSGPLHNIQKHSEFLKNHCKLVQPMISGNFLDIGKVLNLFSSMMSHRVKFQVRYALRQWSMGFGQIVYFGQPEFETLTVVQESSTPIFDVFSTFWNAFFMNFSRTFDGSFLPFGNILWSEDYTRLFHESFDWSIYFAIVNFAFRIGARNDHTFIKSKKSWLSKCKITTSSYESLIFLGNFRNWNQVSEIYLCFIRDFWQTHQKPTPNMSDIDYIRWLFSIPGTFELRGTSWIAVLNALQKGEDPLKQWHPIFLENKGPSFNYRNLSFSTVPIKAEVQRMYDENFIQLLGRNPEIKDYFEESKE